jgi:hypothetical protein
MMGEDSFGDFLKHVAWMFMIINSILEGIYKGKLLHQK